MVMTCCWRLTKRTTEQQEQVQKGVQVSLELFSLDW